MASGNATRSVHIPYAEENNRWFEYEQLWKVTAADVLEAHIAPERREETRVLDFGCGRGEFLKLLRERGYVCEGADFDPECVRLGMQYAPTTLLNDETVASHYSASSFDVVAAVHVLEHLQRPVDAVETLKRITREWLLLVVPNLQSMGYLSVRHRYKANEGHVVGWDFAHFENFLTNICHLDIVELTGDLVVLTTKFGKIDAVLDRLLGRERIRRLERGFLHRRFPYLANSIVALCRKRPDN